MNNWYMEYVTALSGQKITDEEDETLQELFPHIHAVVACGFYAVIGAILDGPITDEQTALLERLKAEEKILSWFARNQIHWAQLRKGMPIRPIMQSPLREWE
jgi:hypothetical protein